MINAKTMAGGLISILLTAGPAAGETHWQLQAVDATGHATYPKVGAMPDPSNLVVLEGVLLNNPENVLDPTPAYSEIPWDLGGQWQIFVQGLEGDHAGTACWMGQNYGNMPWIGYPEENNYSDAAWQAEMDRLNIDPATGHRFRRGDWVRITGFALEYNGKSNINERHSVEPIMDFTVEWLGENVGLPTPEVINLADLKDETDADIFDPSRLTGGEYVQCRFVRINGVSFVDPENWAPGATLTVTDNAGRTLPVRLGVGPDFEGPCNLNGTFDLAGIANQEEGYTTGYQVWVTEYDGNDRFLGAPLAGDASYDGDVDIDDFAVFAVNFGRTDADGPADGDFNRDGQVDLDDFGLLAANFGKGIDR